MVGGASCSVSRRRSWWRTTRGGREEIGLDPPSPVNFDRGSWPHEVQLIPLVVTVSLVRDESGRISKQAFRDKLSNI